MSENGHRRGWDPAGDFSLLTYDRKIAKLRQMLAHAGFVLVRSAKDRCWHIEAHLNPPVYCLADSIRRWRRRSRQRCYHCERKRAS